MYNTDNPDQHTIIIKKDKPEPPTGSIKPLSLLSDIEASYFNGALTVVFNADLGDANIVVSNLTTGDMWSESVSGVGAATLLLSGDEGYYEILIYTDCGDYSGEFVL
ncbi:MAG: hypothetical protein IKB24_01050 [Alistipes sp.]|nr:hypothetical protein [Alistipes sp.]